MMVFSQTVNCTDRTSSVFSALMEADHTDTLMYDFLFMWPQVSSGSHRGSVYHTDDVYKHFSVSMV